MLIRLGEHPQHAKEIALAILLHTDSYLPEGELKRKPLQTIVKLADEADEEPGGKHHYRQIDDKLALKKIQQLDRMVEQQMKRDALDQIS